MLGRVVRIVVAIVLVGILAVLYVLSQGGDLRRQTQIFSDLRNLKEIDTAWNSAIAVGRSDPFAPEQPASQLDTRLEPVLVDLKAETVRLNNPTLSSGVDNLRVAFVQKRKLVGQFLESSARLRATVKDLLTNLRQTRQALTALGDDDPKLRARLGPLDGQLVALQSEVFRVYLQGDEAARKAVQSNALVEPQTAQAY